MPTAPVHVAVSGGGEAGEEACRAAEEVGRQLARRGAVVVTGGLGGAMEAASRGAKAEGGTTVGLLPGEDRDDANPWVDVAVATGLGEGRNVVLVRTVDAVVAVAGEFGTLSEIALALRAGKPVVGLGTWELGRDGQRVDAVVAASTPVEAAEKALALARERRRPPTGS
ncbi:MAG TPA: TIGR00725 family protein [Acidimicrobiales bacterium]|nr:TIGR00725 family protein [Acidimicrobiales bacterium]